MTIARRTREWAGGFAVYAQARMAFMLLLGFSSGLPFLLVFSTLSAWLREAGVSRTDIGLMSYVGLAYTIKFLWAPVLDHLRLPLLDRLLGKRRAWMVLAQLVAAAALAGLSLQNPSASLMPVVLFALVLAFASATQDISIDAWRIEAASDEKQGAMAAVYQLGYRIALIASGAGALYLAEAVSWSAAYLAMALLMGVGIGAALLAPRVAEAAAPVIGKESVDRFVQHFHVRGRAALIVAWGYRAIAAPFIDFFHRYGWWSLVLLALIGLYRVPDFVMGVMANPLYIDLGFSLSTIATVVKLYGIWMTIAGALIGGLVSARIGVLNALLLGALAATFTNLIFVWLTFRGADPVALAVTISIENFSGGFAGTCLIAYMSSLVNHEFAATQYALFSSAFALPGKILGGLSGVMVDGFSAAPRLTESIVSMAPHLTAKTAGYIPFFITTSLMGVPAILLILVVMRVRPGPRPAPLPAAA
ncbi:MAG: AmpG family muropeptide MFS transporter [Alphaproteobacteria bacterium HGW-Alphaproteobacteria-12]|nr:MAG: AmpG family muropeptide MFS transporter [Alphaproteobacteria bacterium HGW-Alphaproteobacteria-12]